MRYGLVLSGGAAKGAFIVGALQWLREEKHIQKYEVISGTSTGSLVGTLVTIQDYANLGRIYTSVETSMLVNPFYPFLAKAFGPEAVLGATALLGGGSIFSTEGLERVIEEYMGDFHEVMDKAEETELIYNTVDMQSGNVVSFSNRKHTAEQMKKALLASANQPVLTPLVTIETSDGQGGTITHQYCDGGVRDHTPLRAVFTSEAEIDRLIVITTSPVTRGGTARPVAGMYEKTTDILLRTIELFGFDVFANDIRTANLYNCLLHVHQDIVENEGEARWKQMIGRMSPRLQADINFAEISQRRSVDVIYVYPENEIEIDNLKFDKREMQAARRLGRQRVAETFANIEDG